MPNVHNQEKEDYKFCIIGKPIIGKSSFVKTILNHNHVIASYFANITRDSIDYEYKYHHKNLQWEKEKW